MEQPPESSQRASSTPRGTAELELGDGSRLVPVRDCSPDRIEGDRDHVFSLADVLRTTDAEPFAGYVRR